MTSTNSFCLAIVFKLSEADVGATSRLVDFKNVIVELTSSRTTIKLVERIFYDIIKFIF